MKNRKKTINKLIEELCLTFNITLACRKVGISRQTFYRWIREDHQLARDVEDALDIGREHISDVSRATLLKRASEGDINSSKYLLNRYEGKTMPQRKIIVGNKIEFVDFSGKKKNSE